MKIAIFSDIHSNLEALEACLEDVRPKGVDQYVFLGDLVGYCADPGPVIDLVLPFVERGGVVVRGNHDAAVARGGSETMTRNAQLAVNWTVSRLPDRHRQFLSSLPLTVRRWNTFFVHASADRPESWIYINTQAKAEQCVEKAQSKLVFAGHMHESTIWDLERSSPNKDIIPDAGTAIPVPETGRWLAVVGSVGQPRDGSASASYAIMDYDALSIVFHRVDYDWRKAADKIRSAGLPLRLAERLGLGE